MSDLILALGESGHGKSRAIKNLDPETTVIINVVGKPLPFPGSRGKYDPSEKITEGGNIHNLEIRTVHQARQAYKQINKILEFVSENRPEVKVVVIDDYQYLISLEYFKETSVGNRSWDRFENVALHSIEVFETARHLRDDLKVFILAHTEDRDGKTVMKTVGNMFREKYTPEGMITTVLIADPLKHADEDRIEEYRFRTQTSGSDVVKSPEEMFPLYIPNDYELVRKRVDEYYQVGNTPEESEVLEDVMREKEEKESTEDEIL